MMRIRFGVLILVFLGSFLALGGKLYRLQIQDQRLYLARAETQYARAGFFKPDRGTVYFTDKNGNAIPVAIKKEYPIVFAVPKEVKDPAAAAHALAAFLNIPKDEIMRKLSKPNDSYELLASKVSNEVVAGIQAKPIPGIYLDTDSFRFYPFNSLAAHVIGFVGASGTDDEIRGRYGIEASLEERLRGTPGSAQGNRVKDPIPGEGAYLTIDRNIQTRAEEILVKLIEEYHAVGGTVIVEDPATGKLLAMGSRPTFDPNTYSAYSVNSFLNPAAQSVYEPGSIFKMFTLSAAFDRGVLTPDSAFVDSGTLTLNGKTIKNAGGKAYGKVTMREVIENSINLGAAFAERALGHAAFYDYVKKFGMGETTGIPLPGEVRGNLKGIEGQARDVNFATASFGQGVAMTPLELVNAVAAIANGGVLMKPLILAEDKPTVVRRAIGAAAAREITDVMVSSVRKNVLAQVPYYTVAGKTGTAQIPDLKRGGYTDELIHSFAGFAPALNGKPRFVILFKLDKPQGVTLAGHTVVRAFQELAAFILNYYAVPPDDLPPARTPQAP